MTSIHEADTIRDAVQANVTLALARPLVPCPAREPDVPWNTCLELNFSRTPPATVCNVCDGIGEVRDPVARAVLLALTYTVSGYWKQSSGGGAYWVEQEPHQVLRTYDDQDGAEAGAWLGRIRYGLLSNGGYSGPEHESADLILARVAFRESLDDDDLLATLKALHTVLQELVK